MSVFTLQQRDKRSSGCVFLLDSRLNFWFCVYRKSSIRSRPLIQVYSIRGRAIGGSVQALIIGKSLNPSKLPYLDHYGLVEIQNFALEIIIFEIPLIQV